MREILSMRMALTANQQQSLDRPTSLEAPSPRASPEQSLQGLTEAVPASPTFTVDTTASPPGAERQQLVVAPHSRLGPNGDVLSLSVGPSNPGPELSSPEVMNHKGTEQAQRKRSITEQELDELSCAEQQLIMSMKLNLPPPQSPELDM